MTAVAERSPASSSESETATIASRSRDWAQSNPTQLAMRVKDFGIWREMAWGQVWETVLDAAHGLLALGASTGDRVSIHSEDRPEWVIMDLATIAIRGVTVGMYPTNPAAEVEYTLNDCGAKLHVVEDQEQADKIIDLPAQAFPSVEKIIYIEPRGIRRSEDPRLLGWDDFLALGQEHRKTNPSAVSDQMAAAQPDDVMTLVYTSGTTGPPKGAMLTNANAAFGLEMIINTPERMAGGKLPGPEDSVLTYLPLCHIAERVFSTWHLAGRGVVLNFGESIESVNTDLREIQPTLFFAVPRIWEKLMASVQIRGADSSPIKKLLLNQTLKMAKGIGKSRVANGGGWTIGTRIKYAIGYVLVFRSLREKLGLRRVRWAGTGAAPVAPEVLEFFLGLGLNVYELYGMTENTAVATANLHGRVKLGTVGEPYPQIKDGVRIDEETGEIQTKHAANFAGYWGKPEKTAETFTEDGWLKTGDVGEWIDGTHIKIVDRMKDIIITAGGKNISPSEIENALKTSPFINEAMVVGDRRKFLSALIAIEADVVGNWAQRKQMSYTTYRDLVEKPEVIELISNEVEKINEQFARVENIRKFTLLPKELDHEDGDLTATQKLKRSSVAESFSDLIEEMYK